MAKCSNDTTTLTIRQREHKSTYCKNQTKFNKQTDMPISVKGVTRNQFSPKQVTSGQKYICITFIGLLFSHWYIHSVTLCVGSSWMTFCSSCQINDDHALCVFYSFSKTTDREYTLVASCRSKEAVLFVMMMLLWWWWWSVVSACMHINMYQPASIGIQYSTCFSNKRRRAEKLVTHNDKLKGTTHNNM